MVIKEKVQKALNKQINAELFSSYLYLSMAAYFESINLLGFANWMHIQAKEENSHAMKFYKYVFDRGGRVTLAAIDAPQSEWKSPLDAFKQAYAHELKVTQMIDDLYKLARAESDAATEQMLQWFINEQVEEEASASQIVERLQMIRDNSNGLLMVDRELAGRK